MSRPKAVVVLSGGADSTVCLYQAIEDGFEVHTVTFDYGQRHKREIMCARLISQRAARTGFVGSHEVIELGAGILAGTSPLVSDAPLEQYKDAQSLPGGLEKTFVPMRNQLFLTIAANRAYVLGANVLYTGVCQEDFGGYPDCRRSFIDLLEMTASEGTFTDEPETLPRLRIITPLMFLTKAQSIAVALTLPGCYESLAFTHTAYDGLYPPTGNDHASLLRAKGFEEAGVPDPLVLRAWMEGQMPMPEGPNYTGIAEYISRIGPLANVKVSNV